jgi:diacylglycerol kinase (ATP)
VPGSKNQSFIARFRFACGGLAAALRSEMSMRVHVTALALLFAVLVVFRPEPLWWALAFLASAAVISTELINTAIEHLADHLHPEIHPSIRIVKDCAAAAVLVAVTGALGVGVALLIHLARGSSP